VPLAGLIAPSVSAEPFPDAIVPAPTVAFFAGAFAAVVFLFEAAFVLGATCPEPRRGALAVFFVVFFSAITAFC